MKKFMIVISLLFPFVLLAQGGRVFDSLKMESKILGMDRKYGIYLPEDYETSQRSYPVLYLLHGGGGDETNWIQRGDVKRTADKVIESGDAFSMIIVMPDASEVQKGYFNSVKGDWQYEDFFFEEFVPYIEKTYRIKARKRFRAIGGLSMGAGGTFCYALHHPDLFSAACPLSGGIRPYSEEREASMKERYYKDATEEQIEQWKKKYDLYALMENMPEERKNDVRWYIDCGDDDRFSESSGLVHTLMKKKEIPHEYRVRDGGHNWKYWREALPEVMKFVSMGF